MLTNISLVLVLDLLGLLEFTSCHRYVLRADIPFDLKQDAMLQEW